MVEFKEGEWFRISGRGDVYATRSPHDIKRKDFGVGSECLIEGHVYVVAGVEYHATSLQHQPDWHKGRPMGILVKGGRR